MSWIRAGVVVIVAALAGAPVFADEVKAFKRAVKGGKSAKIVVAAKALGAKPSKKGVKALIQLGPVCKSPVALVACRDALAEATGGKARNELLKGLKKAKSPSQRMLCAAALGVAGDEEAIKALGAALEDKDVHVRLAAVNGLRSIGSHACGPLLFERLGTKDWSQGGRELEDLHGALWKLTGRSFTEVEEWRNYWKTVDPDDLPVPDPGRAPEGPPSVASLGAGEVRSHNVVLLLDLGSSLRVIDLPKSEWTSLGGKKGFRMWRDPGEAWPPDPGSRFSKMQVAVIEFIQQLGPNTSFSMVGFGSSAQVWQKKLVPGTKSNRKSAVGWVQNLKWSTASRMDEGMKICLGMAADTIWVFGDGVPSGNKGEDLDFGRIVEDADEHRGLRRIRIHAHGFPGISLKAKTNLRRLAKTCDGEYVQFPLPGGEEDPEER